VLLDWNYTEREIIEYAGKIEKENSSFTIPELIKI